MSEQLLKQVLNKLSQMEANNEKILNNMEQQFIKMNHNFNELKNEMTNISKKIDGIKEQVAGNTEQLNHLKDGQGRQERALETLALRSIEHETELRDMRRVK